MRESIKSGQESAQIKVIKKEKRENESDYNQDFEDEELNH